MGVNIWVFLNRSSENLEDSVAQLGSGCVALLAPIRQTVSGLRQREWPFICVQPVQDPYPCLCTPPAPSREEAHGLDVFAAGELSPMLLCHPRLLQAEGTEAYWPEKPSVHMKSCGTWALLHEMGSPPLITGWKKFSVFIFLKKHAKLFMLVWEGNHTVRLQVCRRMYCNAARPHTPRLTWPPRGSLASCVFSGMMVSCLCHRRVTADCSLGAFPLGRGPRAPRSHALCLTDHPVAAVLYIYYSWGKYILCMCFKNH